MIVEVRPGQGTDRLAVLAETRYLVIPDFFGHDMVFGARAVSRPRLRLPAENMLLSLLDAGNAEVMCVWSSNRQEATALRSTAAGVADRRLARFRPPRTSPSGSPAWRGRPVARANGSFRRARAAQVSDWKPPFPAKWRVDVFARLEAKPRQVGWATTSGLERVRRRTPVTRDPGLRHGSQPGHAADDFHAHRHPPRHAGRWPLPVHPADRGAGLRRQPHAGQRDDLDRETVQPEEGEKGLPTRSANGWPRWSSTSARPRRGLAVTTTRLPRSTGF